MTEDKKEETTVVATQENNEMKLSKKTVNKGYFEALDFSKVDMSLEVLLKSGVHFGHMKSRRHPKMDEYIYTTRNNINIIDLQKTLEKLQEALKFLASIQANGKQILFVGTKKQAGDLIVSLAMRLGAPFVTERWIGGTFTNFKVIRERTKYLKESEAQLIRGEFKKYTKFEQSKKMQELEKLEKRMGGIKEMVDLPGAVFIADVKESSIVVQEAQKLAIPVIGIVDTNADPSCIDYPIPANDDAISSLRLILSCVGKALSEGRAATRATTTTEKTVEEKAS